MKIAYGEWIPLCADIYQKPEVIRLARLTAASTDETVGRLGRFWCWAQKCTDNGDIPGITIADLVAALRLDESFWTALITVGWLQETKAGLRIPNAAKWISGGTRARLVEARRKKQQRAINMSRSCPENVPKMSHENRDQTETETETETENENVRTYVAKLVSRGISERHAKSFAAQFLAHELDRLIAFWDSETAAGKFQRPPAALQKLLTDPSSFHFQRGPNGWERQDSSVAAKKLADAEHAAAIEDARRRKEELAAAIANRAPGLNGNGAPAK